VLIAFHKPYGVLSQFTPDGSPNLTLAEFGFPPRVYPIGRLDADSEGLLLLSDEPQWNQRLLNPKSRHSKVYWAQVERIPAESALNALRAGAPTAAEKYRPCRAWLLDPQPAIPPRNPPIRQRKTVPDCWIALELMEGKNRQVRKMTAAVGHPTLRLIRTKIGELELGELPAGKWHVLDQRDQLLLTK
jgi:23S rRNA pseudouridine2457 synthase